MGKLPQGRLDDLAAMLRPGEVSATAGQGYFKLQRAERRDSTTNGIPAGQPRLLVVRTAVERRRAAYPQNLLTPEGRRTPGSWYLRKPEQFQLNNDGLFNRSPLAARLGCPTGAACCSGRPVAWRTTTSGSSTRCSPSTPPAAGTKVRMYRLWPAMLHTCSAARSALLSHVFASRPGVPTLSLPLQHNLAIPGAMQAAMTRGSGTTRTVLRRSAGGTRRC